MTAGYDELEGMSADDLTALYVGLRDRKAELEGVKKEITATMDLVEAKMMEVLEAAGAESIATESGTFFVKESVKYNVEDWDAFWSFASQADGGAFVTKSPRKASVDEYVEAHGELPPGLSRFSERNVNVRRK